MAPPRALCVITTKASPDYITEPLVAVIMIVKTTSELLTMDVEEMPRILSFIKTVAAGAKRPNTILNQVFFHIVPLYNCIFTSLNCSFVNRK